MPSSKVVIFWQITETEFDAVILDVSINEGHAGSASITSHPIELGSETSDHIIAEPDRLTIEGMISNTPAILGAEFRVDADRAEQGYERLLTLQKQGYLATIITTLREYDSMALEKINVPRNSSLGHACQYTLEFKQVEVVESETVDAPEPTMERAKPKKATGRKGSKDASTEVSDKSKSLLLTIAEAVTE